jgi:hypothetical protein
MLFEAGTLWAHHSPSALFYMFKPLTLTGTVTKMDWINLPIVCRSRVRFLFAQPFLDPFL